VQLADLALGQGHDPSTGEGQELVNTGDVLLIARQAIKGLRYYHIELTGAGAL